MEVIRNVTQCGNQLLLRSAFPTAQSRHLFLLQYSFFNSINACESWAFLFFRPVCSKPLVIEFDSAVISSSHCTALSLNFCSLLKCPKANSTVHTVLIRILSTIPVPRFFFLNEDC